LGAVGIGHPLIGVDQDRFMAPLLSYFSNFSQLLIGV
jgi:hypothetical protein